MDAQRDFNPHLGYKEDVIRENMKLAYSIANKYKGSCNSGVSYEDLVSEAVIGLIKAFNGFDPTRFEGNVTKFSTYAVPYVRGSVAVFLRDKGRTVRVPRHLYEVAGKIMKLDMYCFKPEEIAKRLDITAELARQALEHVHSPGMTYLDQSISSDGEGEITILDLMPNQDDQSGMFVRDFLDTLNERERKLLEYRMDGRTQIEIGEIFGLSQTQISRLLVRIGKKLKLYMSTDESEGNTMKSEVITRKITQQEAKRHGVKTLFEGIEWYSGVAPKISSIGINGVGVHLNDAAAKELECVKGDRIEVGFNADLMCLVIRKSDKGHSLSQAYGNNGSICVNSKRMGKWLQTKNIARKRYALEYDETTGIHFIQVEREAKKGVS